MKFALVQISGGVGAQVIGCIATKALRDKGYRIFIDGRYFGRHGKQCIPKGINYFDKVLSDSILKFSIFEKSRFICKVVKIIFIIGSRLFPRSMVYYEDIPNGRRSAANEAAEYVYSTKASDHLKAIKADLFASNHHNSQFNVVAHVRRGDYIAAGLPITPLQCIFEMVGKMVSKPSFDLLIVTDSPLLIKSELHNDLHKDVNVIIQQSELLDDLYSLVNAETFVASDSQFSMIAIWLSDTMKRIACPIRFNQEKFIKSSSYESIDWY